MVVAASLNTSFPEVWPDDDEAAENSCCKVTSEASDLNLSLWCPIDLTSRKPRVDSHHVGRTSGVVTSTAGYVLTPSDEIIHCIGL